MNESIIINENDKHIEQEPITNIQTYNNGDVILTIKDDVKENIRKRKRKRYNQIVIKKRKKNPKKFKHYSCYERKGGKEIFMIIKMDQWGQVNPECLEDENEMKNIRKIFEYIWDEMYPSERYAYMQYSKIDEKYQIAIENSFLYYISSSFWGVWNEVSQFFNDIICSRERCHKIN